MRLRTNCSIKTMVGEIKMKTRKQGNGIVLTIPAKFGIEENVEYLAVKGEGFSDDSVMGREVF